jgi:hypothetical protein
MNLRACRDNLFCQKNMMIFPQVGFNFFCTSDVKIVLCLGSYVLLFLWPHLQVMVG